MRKIEFTPTAMPLNNFIAMNNRKLYVLNPAYQRKFVWKKQLQEDLLLSVFAGLPIGTVIIYDDGNKKQIVDGLQRISTLQKFYNNEFSLSPTVSKKIVSFFIDELSVSTDPIDRKLYKAFNNDRFMYLNYDKLPSIMKEHYQSYLMSIVEIRYATSETIYNYFRLVQNSEKLKSGQIIKAIPDNKVTSIFNVDEYEKLAISLNIDNKREDLLKFMVQFHALYEGKLPLGASDKLIESYATKNPDILPAFENRMRIFYDKLQQYEGVVIDTKLNKSVLKIIFLFVLYTDEWKEVPIDQFIKAINHLYDKNKFIFNTKNEEKINPLIESLLNLTRSNHYNDEIKQIISNLDVSEILK